MFETQGTLYLDVGTQKRVVHVADMTMIIIWKHEAQSIPVLVSDKKNLYCAVVGEILMTFCKTDCSVGWN